mgnify:CR=1 FL=1
MVRSGDRSLLSNELGNLPARLPPQKKGGGGGIPAIITGGSGPYTADLYANGYGNTATETDVEVELLNLNASETVPTDGSVKIIVTKAKTSYTAIT